MEARRFFWSSRPIILIKALWFASIKAFVRPSIIIFFIGTYQVWIVWRWTTCLSQWKWISIWRSLVCSFIAFLTRSRIVYWLSHSIVGAFGRINIRDFISQERNIASLAICKAVRNSVSIEEVVTVSCLLALYVTAPPNNVII